MPRENRHHTGRMQDQISAKHINRLKIVGAVLTLGGICLFAYFVYSVGLDELVEGIERFGLAGFIIILLVYGLRICTRALAWQLSVYEDGSLSLRDTIPAVIIGEAMSSTIPLGILISGTSKAVAVRRKLPLVAGLSSVATENLFYSLITSIFLIIGAFVFLRNFSVDETSQTAIDILIGGIVALLVFLIIMVVRQWHPASGLCDWLYARGFLHRFLEHTRIEVRRFEDLIYGFYRRHPSRFLPICGLETAYHILGVAEVWFILHRLSDAHPGLMTSFLLESVSRLITILFKLIPFVIGVDEAGAQFVGHAVALGAGIGVTLAIIRKGRILFWTAVGLVLIVKRGLTVREMSSVSED